ncbi:MAG: orotidine-5'-phosphate decarboxylase [Chloroflexi bacterium]|nr:orotidine-5'-phosphate decarboxylase [Chloroflexota bacterium]
MSRFEDRARAVDSDLCVGLDLGPHTDGLLSAAYDNPGRLNRHLIDLTQPYAAAYKFQLAGYLAMGMVGFTALRTSIAYLRTAYAAVPVILDAKVNDIRISLDNYASFAFDYLGVDAITANPLLGAEANQPLLQRTDRRVYFLASTTNEGSGEFQAAGIPPLYERIAERVATWGENVGLVVGSTHPERIRAIREAAPDLPFLVPGLGAQGGDPSAFMALAAGSSPARVLVNSSRSIIRAADPAEAARAYVRTLRNARSGDPRPPVRMAARVRSLLEETGCVQRGTFTLASGATSDIYVDLRLLAAHPRALARIAALLALDRPAVDVLATIPTAGLPLGTALSLHTGLPLAYIRQRAKDYGRGKRIEGARIEPGQRVLLLDDVISPGGSKEAAITAIRAAGADVVALAVVVDRREQPGTPFMGVPVRALATLADLRIG